jgi:hypothetical protein
MSSQFHFFVDLEHLDAGIICPTTTGGPDRGSIDKALSYLTPEEARKMKRKFRKLARRKTIPEQWKQMTRRQKRNRVLSALWGRALTRFYDMLPEDNFE